MIYSIVHFIFSILFKILFRFEVIGKENIPKEGPVVIASNHASLFDPPLLGTAANRPVHFMAKEELFVPVLGSIYKTLGAFPVKRGASDIGALKHALVLLSKDKVVGIFPEGTRTKTGKLGPAGPGTCMIASRGKATIVPTAIIGSALKRNKSLWPKIKVVFGKPIPYRENISINKENLHEMTEEMMSKIAELLEQN